MSLILPIEKIRALKSRRKMRNHVRLSRSEIKPGRSISVARRKLKNKKRRIKSSERSEYRKKVRIGYRCRRWVKYFLGEREGIFIRGIS
jgi:hypothetical protein